MASRWVPPSPWCSCGRPQCSSRAVRGLCICFGRSCNRAYCVFENIEIQLVFTLFCFRQTFPPWWDWPPWGPWGAFWVFGGPARDPWVVLRSPGGPWAPFAFSSVLGVDRGVLEGSSRVCWERGGRAAFWKAPETLCVQILAVMYVCRYIHICIYIYILQRGNRTPINMRDMRHAHGLCSPVKPGKWTTQLHSAAQRDSSIHRYMGLAYRGLCVCF